MAELADAQDLKSCGNFYRTGSIPVLGTIYIYGPLAQLVEHLTFNQGVPRSSRGWITIWRGTEVVITGRS